MEPQECVNRLKFYDDMIGEYSGIHRCVDELFIPAPQQLTSVPTSPPLSVDRNKFSQGDCMPVNDEAVINILTSEISNPAMISDERQQEK